MGENYLLSGHEVFKEKNYYLLTEKEVCSCYLFFCTQKSVVIGNLKHFSDYRVEVRQCM